MSHTICKWLEHVKLYQSGQWSCFCYVGISCEGVDSNQYLPLPCNHCINMFYLIKAICFDVHVKNGLCTHINCSVQHLDTLKFEGILCIYAVRNMGRCNGLIGKCIVEDRNKLQGWMSNTKKCGWSRSRRTRSWMILIHVKKKGKWFKHIGRSSGSALY